MKRKSFFVLVEIENDAFCRQTLDQDNDPRPELGRILRATAEHVEGFPPLPGESNPIRDINGNRVGHWGFTV